MKKILILLLSILAIPGFALIREVVPQLYIGGRAGNVALTGAAASNYKSAVGYALDLAMMDFIRDIDFYYSWQTSPHGGPENLTLQAHNASVEFHPLELNDLDVTLGIGPGFYSFKLTSGTQSRLGLQLGTTAALILSDRIYLGVTSRYHLVSGSPVSGNLWTFMARIGYSFPV